MVFVATLGQMSNAVVLLYFASGVLLRTGEYIFLIEFAKFWTAETSRGGRNHTEDGIIEAIPPGVIPWTNHIIHPPG